MGPFLFGVCAFTSVFVGTGTLYRIATMINEYGASAWAAVRVFILALPSIVVLTFPMSVLLGALMAFGRMSSSSEMIVMRAGGQNFMRLAMPIFVTAVFISLGTTAFNEYVVPKANSAYNAIIDNEVRHNAAPQTQDHIVIKNVPYRQDESMKDYVYDVCRAIGYNNTESIKSAFRLSRNTNKSNPIVMKFYDVADKRDFMHAYFQCQNVNLMHLGFKTKLRIVISDALTQKNNEIFKKAMQLKFGKIFWSVSTKNGLVY